jgi:hypothetical protein
MNDKETRHEQYLRILKNGPSGDNDNEAIRYLVDKGYTDSKYFLSFTDTSRKVASTIWCGPNSSGLDYIDDLQLKVAKPDSEEGQPVPNNSYLEAEHGAPSDNRRWDEKPPGTLFLGVIKAVVAFIIIFYISKHL